ncbi:trehalose-phosphatase [Reyranella sp.]|uniref:trehalose-phosphatase n=1 Tax=Reyranella sp. TaxID=1929291 RepID=UPI002F93B45D
MTPPELDRKSALFLDLDGTLLEIAATPEQVVVPPGLPALLTHLHHQLDGALAIVTGRPLPQIDELLRPFVPSAAGEHGVSLRYADGTREELPAGIAVPTAWRDALQAAAERWPGVLVEPKPHGLAVHYRLAPEYGNEVWRLVRELVPPEHPWFRLVPAREAVEIGLRAASKGHAVERLMAHAPFHGRRPIFVGDDFTDEAGMTKARELGGVGLRVAEAFGGDPAKVRAWLAQGAHRLDGRSALPAVPSGGMP